MELTKEQQFELEKIKRIVERIPREELEKMFLSVTQQNMMLNNFYKDLLKTYLST